MSRVITAVELIGRYSNHDKWGHLSDTNRTQPSVGVEVHDELVARPSSCSRSPWPVVDRLGDQTVRELLRDRRSGMMQRVLAARYDISLSPGLSPAGRHGCVLIN
jgi:hypothetical protein